MTFLYNVGPVDSIASPNLRGDRNQDDYGSFVQVSRLGWPLINEVIIPLQDKDKYNRTCPRNDVSNFGAYILDPEVRGRACARCLARLLVRLAPSAIRLATNRGCSITGRATVVAMATPTGRHASARYPDLDWLRVVCIAILLAYHVGMFFVSWDWHLKSPEPLRVLERPMAVLHVLRMPLLMLLAGTSTAFALGKRSLGGFLLDRTRRLFGPLMFGMLVVVPPQIYVERVWKGQFHGSYLDFWPSVLEGTPYPAGNTSWHHLWFVAYLFAYCLLGLPLLAWLGRPGGRVFLARFERAASRGGALFLLFAPLAAIRIALRNYPETHALFDDPDTFASYAYLFAAGHLLGRCPSLWDRVAVQRRLHLAIFVGLLLVLAPDSELPFPLEHVAVWAMSWSGILTALGYARAHVHVRRPWLAHAQGLAYPFYIWHQTVILMLAFGLLRWDPGLGPWPRFVLVLGASFVVSWGLCELVARIPLLRPCFGMAPRKPRTAAPAVYPLHRDAVA
jgi:peptidoglycan/LPS O-acetylase OafA/YrhL